MNKHSVTLADGTKVNRNSKAAYVAAVILKSSAGKERVFSWHGSVEAASKAASTARVSYQSCSFRLVPVAGE